MLIVKDNIGDYYTKGKHIGLEFKYNYSKSFS